MRDTLLLSTHDTWSKRRGISVLKESNANAMVVKRLGLFGVAARKGLVSLMALGIGLLDLARRARFFEHFAMPCSLYRIL